MTVQSAFNTWRSIRTTFFLFLVVVPIVLVTGDGEGKHWSDLAASAAGMIGVAAFVAELLRQGINYLAGSKVCHWVQSA